MSRYKRPGTADVVDQYKSEEDQRSKMLAAYNKLEVAKVEVLPTCLTAADIVAHPTLKQFICWEADLSVVGISEKKSGGLHNKSKYYQVSHGKNFKYMAHKLSRCLADPVNIVLYTDFEALGDTSHLCHRHLCWRPDHLTTEDHQTNVDRGSCVGWIYETSGPRLLCMCEHEPLCKRLRVIESVCALEKPLLY